MRSASGGRLADMLRRTVDAAGTHAMGGRSYDIMAPHRQAPGGPANGTRVEVLVPGATAPNAAG